MALWRQHEPQYGVQRSHTCYKNVKVRMKAAKVMKILASLVITLSSKKSQSNNNSKNRTEWSPPGLSAIRVSGSSEKS